MKDNDKQREEKSQKPKLGWQKLSKRRWVYPAIYIVAVALILTGVLWMQAVGNKNDASNKTNPKSENQVSYKQQPTNNKSVPANSAEETFQMPVVHPNAVEIEKQFYDVNGSKEEQQAALVNINNTYQQNTGIDIVAKNGKSFSVTAAMSGIVEKAKQDPLLGYEVVLKHKNGVETYYESLESVTVQPGEKVSQGEVIGKAGRSEFNKDAGIHAHFEIRKDNIPVDPVSYFKKDVSSLSDVKVTSSVPEAPSKDNSKSKSNDQSNKKDNSNNKNSNNNNNNNTDNNSSNQDNNANDSSND